MPKATLSFKLPEEKMEYTMAIQAADFHSALWEFSMWIRSVVKYEDRTDFTPQEVQTKFHEILAENGVEM